MERIYHLENKDVNVLSIENIKDYVNRVLEDLRNLLDHNEVIKHYVMKEKVVESTNRGE